MPPTRASWWIAKGRLSKPTTIPLNARPVTKVANMKKIALAVALVASLALTACSTFENYKKPEEPFPNCVGCYSGG